MVTFILDKIQQPMAIYDHTDNLAEPESIAAGSVIITL